MNSILNKNNQKTIIFFVASITLAFLLGYFLFKTSSNPKIIGNPSADHHSGSVVSVNSQQLNSLVGNQLPNIQLVDKDGKIYTNDSFKSKNTVLFFNEGLMCYPACWNQIAMLGSDVRFNTTEIRAFSVLVDASKDWQTAINKMPELAKANTLFDAGAVVSKQLGILTLPSSMHRGSLPGHTYIIIDKNGIVQYVNDDPNMAIANDILIKEIANFDK